MITQLIDTQDNAEAVRDKIAEILASEFVSQQAIATGQAKDPAPYDIRVYSERSSPWDIFIEREDEDRRPAVNVTFESDQTDARASGVVTRQRFEGRFYVDCIAYADSYETPAGHEPGDAASALRAMEVARLSRQILMAGVYTYLSLRGVVGRRMVSERRIYRPDAAQGLPVTIVRLTLDVEYNEFAPQVEGPPLEEVGVEVNRQADGLLLVSADYNYT